MGVPLEAFPLTPAAYSFNLEIPLSSGPGGWTAHAMLFPHLDKDRAMAAGGADGGGPASADARSQQHLERCFQGGAGLRAGAAWLPLPRGGGGGGGDGLTARAK